MIENSFPFLQTKRLTLRRLETEDQADVQHLRSHPEVIRYIKRDPPSAKEALEFIQRIHRELEEGKSIQWVLSSSNESFMGTICLWNFSEDKLTAEMGYDLLPEFHHQGYMSEAAGTVLDYGFQQLDLRRIEAYTHHDNIPSIRLLEKFGFRPDPDQKDSEDPDNRVYYLERKS
jgi:ribosomal-protein-alanine N-acetyltransferase